MRARVSPRQREILRLIGRGLSDREIGARLAISEHTVATHVRVIMARFRARSRAHAVYLFVQR